MGWCVRGESGGARRYHATRHDCQSLKSSALGAKSHGTAAILTVVGSSRAPDRIAANNRPAGRTFKGEYFPAGKHAVEDVRRYGIRLFGCSNDRNQHGLLVCVGFSIPFSWAACAGLSVCIPESRCSGSQVNGLAEGCPSGRGLMLSRGRHCWYCMPLSMGQPVETLPLPLYRRRSADAESASCRSWPHHRRVGRELSSAPG